MKSVYKLLSLSLLLILMLSETVLAHEGKVIRREFTKVIKKDFSISQGGTVALDNQYGQIDVKTWDKQRVKIDVTVVVEASGESEAQRTFDRINISFTDDKYRVGATTHIESKSNKWFIGGNWDSKSANDYKIKFVVYLPRDSRLEVQAKYCNVTVVDIMGAADINVKYGNFRLDGLGEDSKVAISYGKGSIGEARDIDLYVAHGGCTIDEAKDIKAETKNAQVFIHKAGDLRMDTRNDNYRIGEIRTMHNEGRYDNFTIDYADEIFQDSRYTNLQVGRLGSTLDVDMDHGSVYIEQLSRNFNSIEIYGRYSDFKLGLEKGSPFRIDATGDHAKVHHPADVKVTEEMDRSSSYSIKGYRGSSSAKLIKARLTYGGLKLIE